MIAEGSYLTPSEMEKYQSDHLEHPTEPEELEQYRQSHPEQPQMAAVEPPAEPAPPTEITDADIDKLLIEDWGIVERKQKIYALYLAGKTDEEVSWTLNSEYLRRSYGEGNRQTSGPCTLADGSAAFARYDYSMNIVSRPREASRTVSYEEMARHIRRLIDEGRYLSPDELARYNADHAPEAQTAAEPPESTPAPTVPAEQEAPAFANPQDAIDDALREWNGDIASKRAVSRYMGDHARDQDTAEWLRREYGGVLPAFPVPAAQTDLSWPKVQRRLALLIKEDRFFTEEELDNFADVDTAEVRENLERGSDSAFVQIVTSDVERLDKIEESAAEVPDASRNNLTIRDIYGHYAPVVKNLVMEDTAYQNACVNSDREAAELEGHEAVRRAALTIQDPVFMRQYYDNTAFHNRLHQEIISETYPMLSRPQKEAEAISAGPGEQSKVWLEAEKQDSGNETATGAADQPPHDPLAPAYHPGDTIYLDSTAYEITGIGAVDVEFTDTFRPIPLQQSMDKWKFEQRLRLDPRNSHITLYLPADLGYVNDDLRDVLVNHLLTDRDKGYISGWIRSGENNRGLAMRLSDALASRAETVTLETGEKADYFTSTVSIEVNILNDQDEKSASIHTSWEETASIFRALWLQELDGFTHEPVQRGPVTLEGRLSYQVGDKVFFDGGDHDVSGTIESIDNFDVLIHTGPYAWSHETVSRDFLENALRHDERNASLFTPEPPEMRVEATTIYPADKNNLPYDVVVERLHFDEPEQSQQEPSPNPRNFRIIDDHLGEGGAKEKFQRNMEAITLLHDLEFDGRQASPEEQEILSRYVGWGALADAFDESKSAWANEFQELYAVLSPDEYAAARAATLNSHYTSPAVIKAIYEAVGNMGFKTGNILEPSCGAGNFFGLLPEEMSASKLYGVALDSVYRRVADYR